MNVTLLPIAEAVRRLGRDHELLDAAVRALPPNSLARPYLVEGGPLGDFCESLHDLVAHVLMWDEINLAALTEARAGRSHWSLDAQWEQPDAGRLLNRAGVMSGRQIPDELLLHRFDSIRAALLDELRSTTDEQWRAQLDFSYARATSMGELAQHVMTVPDAQPFWHAAIHLGQLAAATGDPA